MKTGQQVFKSVIFDNIDITIEVTEVFPPLPMEQTDFAVCNAKWAVPGDVLLDPNDAAWPIVAVDYETNIIRVSLPGDGVQPIYYGEILRLQPPYFWSGTRTNVNEELSARQADSVPQFGPIVWLKEVIRAKLPPQSGPNSVRFSFTWACLNFYNDETMLNADRHARVVYPMVQLGKEVLDTIDRVSGIERPETCEMYEFSRFGTESKNGFERLIIDLKLSGTAYTASVEVDEMHYCKC